MLRDGDFNRILKDIENAALNQKKDRFVKKYGFVACNEFYKDKSGLPDLPQTKNDLSSIKRTFNMMDIKQENIFELVDAGHDEIEDQFEQMNDSILIQVPTLSPLTGIGSN